MGSVLGKNITLTIFGESHGKVVGATLAGLPSGIKIDENFINSQMMKRKAVGGLTTPRIEDDKVKFISGVKDGFSNGNPLTVIIENNDYDDREYINKIARPSHSDFVTFMRHKEYGERRGGGFSSGRLTAPIVALGAIVISILESKNIHISSSINKKVLDKIDEVRKDGNSIGAEVTTIISGVDIGIGEPMFDSMESVFAHAIFSIPGVKGVSFGLGFKYDEALGSEVNDQFIIKNDKVTTKTNNSGGIDGGMTNGNDIVIHTVFKPTPSIAMTQNALNLETMRIEEYKIEGRHDACIALRGQVVVDSILAISLFDMLVEFYGKRYFSK
ncbi:MAG: chorismate synthase [Erysipelotrichales bacterium]|nr:chorismate synthase [Erysipelotrichales bacterium]